MKLVGLRAQLPFTSLEEIFQEGSDPHGLLKSVKPKRKQAFSDSPLVRRLEEINQFIDQKGREPELESDDFNEELLAETLMAIKQNEEQRRHLYSFDRHGLLQNTQEVNPPVMHEQKKKKEIAAKVTSLDDIFATGGDLLSLPKSEIFNLKHVPRETKNMPDEIADRFPCEDFWRFEPLFQDMHTKLQQGAYTLQKFSNNSQIREGDFFILKGVSCLVDAIGTESERDDYYNPRLRLIFENGQESNMLMRSLAASLYKEHNGRRVIKGADDIVDAFNQVSHRDKPLGYIYVLRSLANKPELAAYPELHKIGFTTTSVEQRICNAENDIAFLEAPVKLVTSFACYHINPQKLELLTHTFLEAQRLNITLIGKNGESYQPQEWFNVSLDTIKEVISKISNGTINQYRMNNTTMKLMKK